LHLTLISDHDGNAGADAVHGLFGGGSVFVDAALQSNGGSITISSGEGIAFSDVEMTVNANETLTTSANHTDITNSSRITVDGGTWHHANGDLAIGVYSVGKVIVTNGGSFEQFTGNLFVSFGNYSKDSGRLVVDNGATARVGQAFGERGVLRVGRHGSVLLDAGELITRGKDNAIVVADGSLNIVNGGSLQTLNLVVGQDGARASVTLADADSQVLASAEHGLRSGAVDLGGRIAFDSTPGSTARRVVRDGAQLTVKASVGGEWDERSDFVIGTSLGGSFSASSSFSFGSVDLISTGSGLTLWSPWPLLERTFSTSSSRSSAFAALNVVDIRGHVALCPFSPGAISIVTSGPITVSNQPPKNPQALGDTTQPRSDPRTLKVRQEQRRVHADLLGQPNPLHLAPNEVRVVGNSVPQ
jgi:hypothetical protein